ncbi:MAG: DUF72 domain-containing protein [Planctomycetes bacterium]|nr:DUF72 domain-containing protein [Planctomycetota bacterium]
MPKARVFVGTAGWSYPDWDGVVYPAERPRGFRPLPYLARWLDCVEVNTTFYRPVTARTAQGWVEQTADRPDFRFTVKLWQRFTHERATAWSAAELSTWKEGIAPLVAAGRLAATVWQFPWSFRNQEESRVWLARLADALPEVPAVVEVRHRSWDTPAALAFLRARGLAFANIDQPALRDCLGPTAHVTAPSLAYVRLHGRNAADWFRPDAGRDARYDYYYNAAELDEWRAHTQALLAEAAAVYVIANNHFRGQAPANALQLKARLAGDRVPVPPALLAAYPDLSAIAAALASSSPLAADAPPGGRPRPAPGELPFPENA